MLTPIALQAQLTAPQLPSITRTSTSVLTAGTPVSFTFGVTLGQGDTLTFINLTLEDAFGNTTQLNTNSLPGALASNTTWLNGSYTVNYVSIATAAVERTDFNRNGIVVHFNSAIATPTTHPVSFASSDFALVGGTTTSPAALTSQPASTTANAGQSVILSLTATGSPTPTIQWFKEGKAITGATNSSLIFASVFGGDAGSYTATVSNVYNGSTYDLTTAPAVLTVITTPPTITTQPVSQTLVAGGNVSFSVAATGSEPMVHRWYRDGVEISGATSSSLTINGVQPSDAGGYRVSGINWANQIKALSAGSNHTMLLKTDGTLWGMGYNFVGRLGDGTTTSRTTPVRSAGGLFSNAATLTVNTPPVITTQPATQAVTVGFPINLVVVATGNPAPTYQWRKSGSDIPDATNASYTIPSATAGHAGIHTVVVTNSVSSVTSNEAVVTVTAAAPATITVQPTHVTANLGQSATLSVTVSGSPTPSIQWLKNGSAIAGATTTSCAISSVSPADAATYTATVHNVYNGTTYSLTTSPAVLTVIAVPVFTTHPVSRTVLAGTQVALSAAVQGLAATTFQWRKNGSAIGGATGSSYAIAAAATTDSETYTVVATNGEDPRRVTQPNWSSMRLCLRSFPTLPPT